MKVLVKYSLNGEIYESVYEAECLTYFVAGRMFKRELGYPADAIRILSVKKYETNKEH